MIALLLAAMVVNGTTCILPQGDGCWGMANAPKKKSTWSSLVTYSDGRVITHEGMKSEKLCQEVLCSIRYSQTCTEREAELAKAKAEADRKEAAYKASIPAWRAKHPCQTITEKNFSDKPTQVLKCSLPNGGEEWHDLKGKLLASVGIGTSSSSMSYFPPSSFITHAVCYNGL